MDPVSKDEMANNRGCCLPPWQNTVFNSTIGSSMTATNKTVPEEKKITPKGVFCLEGLWNTDLKNHSTVQPLLAFLKQNANIPYIYGDVGTPQEFEFYISKFSQKGYINYPILYLAFHGNESGGILELSGKTKYTISEIGDKLKGKCENKIILIASCNALKVDSRILKKFLEKSGALAICGYTNRVHWMRSSAFEMLLFDELQDREKVDNTIEAKVKRCMQLAKVFRHTDELMHVGFKMVSRADL